MTRYITQKLEITKASVKRGSRRPKTQVLQDQL